MPPKPEPGLVVGGRYRLGSVLGEGGMAVVWRATHTETDREVALKLVRSELATEPEVRDMFVREARIAARIGKSEHIVDVLDAGIDEALVTPFLAMELIHGEPLDVRLKREGPVAPAVAVLVLEQVGEALDQAHAAGVFHRDLKPQNLFLATDRKQKLVAKVLDFGIAKLSETVHQSSTHVGTPAYAAPEQLGPSWRTIAEQQGKTISREVSAATDVWALALVAYEMLTGSPSGALWGATTLAELPVKIVLEPPPIASRRAGAKSALLPPGFDAWLARGLDLDAAKRWASASEAARTFAVLFGAAPGERAPSHPSLAPSHHPSFAPQHATHPQHASRPPHASPPPHASAPPPHASTPPSPFGGPVAAGFSYPALPSSAAVTSPTLSHDPHLIAWAAARGAEVRPGDARVFFAWQPFVFLPRIERVLREARLTTPSAQLIVGEVTVDDALRKATGEDRMLLALVGTPKARGRISVRAKKVTGLADGMAAGLKLFDDLVGAPRAPSVLGDPHFERVYDVTAPSPAEAQYALPVAARQVLMGLGFVGTLEVRVGGFALAVADARLFDPSTLDRIADLASRLAAALS